MSGSAQLHADLPIPAGPRWQPLRIGLVELFHYDTEEFWFRDGHLLLRGNNGTGKSKVLALTLPFLLDGDASPHRVEPDGDPKKRMEWNLLLGGAHDERTGYAWVEFGLIEPDGTPRYQTLAIGMKAAAGRGVADKWYAITSRRMGHQIHLVDANGIVIGKDRLREAVAGEGMVLDRAEDYRRRVNEQLFGLVQHRYDALLEMLVQLRQPQLSKRPDMRALNRALTEALPPLSPSIIGDVAEAMRNLERERQDLADLEQARRAVGRFDGAYRTYAGIATVRRADEVRTATTAYEQTGRDLGKATADRDVAAEQVQQLQAEEQDHRRRVRTLEARIATLRESPEMRDADRLHGARERAETLRRQAGAAARRLADAAERLTSAEQRHAAAATRHDRVSTELDEVRATVAHAADGSGLGEGRADGPALSAAVAAPGDKSAAQELVRRRREALAHVRRLAQTAQTAAQDLARGRAELDTKVGLLDQATEAHRRSQQTLDEVVTIWLTGLEQAARDWAVLPQDGVADALTAAAEWASDLTGPEPFAAVATQTARTVEADLARQQAAIASARDGVQADVDQAEAELSRLESGVQPVPVPSATRATEERDQRPGAPLWQVVDFVDGVSPREQAGLEAALEGAGLLDAWVTPGGGLLEPDTLDVAVTIGAEPVERSVAAVLRPAVDRAGVGSTGVVDPGVVAGILARIGLGPATGETWIAGDGRFKLGLAEGAWTKPAAEFLGQAAREESRQRHIEDMLSRLAELARTLATLDHQQASLDDRRLAVRTDIAVIPADQPVRDAHAVLALADSRVTDAASAVEAADSEVVQAEQAAIARAAERDQAAAELDLPVDDGALQAVAVALQQLAEALAGLWPQMATMAAAQQALDDAQADVVQAQAARRSRIEESAQAERERDTAVERFGALQEMVGEPVKRILETLAAAQTERDVAVTDADARRESAAQAATTRDRALGRVETLEGQLDERREARAEAVDRLRRLASTGLVRAALPAAASPEESVGSGQVTPSEPDPSNPAAGLVEVPDPSQPWKADPGVRLARDIRRELPDVAADDRTWDRAGTAMTTSLEDLQRTLAGQGARTWQEPRESVLVVRVHMWNQDFEVHRLGQVLDQRMEDRRRVLDVREQQILEEHLVTEVAAVLATKISEAEQQVDRMNRELTNRPTSTGMVLRLRWRPDPLDGPAGLDQALKRLLRQTSGAWSTDDREALGSFLQAEIQRCRAADETATWVEHLTRAFDYRSWYRFVVERRQGDGTWRSADGPASGGERVLAVTIPLFAAASAHYSSAGKTAPRMVLLDEAFAGVDDAARRQCLGLLDTFDLDYVLTSEREWGCYPEVPGLAICHLVRRDGIDAVHVSRWEWEGSGVPVQRDQPAQSARQPAAAPDPPSDGLFDA